MDRLSELAAQWGIDSDYVDARGERRIADPEALAKIVDAVAADRVPPPERLLPATIIVRQGRPAQLDLPSLAHGVAVRWEILAADEPVAGGQLEATALRLPDDLAI